MIKSVDFPQREFATKSELFDHLILNKSELIALKKSDVKKSDGVSFDISSKSNTSLKSIEMDEGFIYPVINTTKWMDSHNDVHIDGIWDRSVKDQQSKIYYLVDHDMKIASVVAYPKDVEVLIQPMTFTELGYTISGSTQALMFKVSKESIRLQSAKEVVNEKIPIEHSVRMQYVNLFMCIDDENYKEEKANWETYYPYVANKEKADSEGYFWAVTEAKIYKEGSMVLAGSNSITPLLQKDNIDSSETDRRNKEADTITSNENKKKHLL